MPATAIPGGWEVISEPESSVPEGWEVVPEQEPEQPTQAAPAPEQLVEQLPQPRVPDSMQPDETTREYKRRKAVARGTDPDLEEPTASAATWDEAVVNTRFGISYPTQHQPSQEEIDAARTTLPSGADDKAVSSAIREMRFIRSLPKITKDLPAGTLPTGMWFANETGRVFEQTDDGPVPVKDKSLSAAATRESMALFAKERLAKAWFPRVGSTLVQLGSDVTSMLLRAVGSDTEADDRVRFGSAYASAAEPYHQKSWSPLISKAISGVGRTLPTTIVGGYLGGGYGAIAIASATESNLAVTEGRDAGLRGSELAGFVARAGTIEALPAIIMQRIGFGGVEKLLGGGGKKAVEQGIRQGLKRAGITTLQEIPEELVTELGHSLNTALSGVDEQALSPEALKETAAQTIAQTIITVAAVSSPDIATGAMADQQKRDLARLQALPAKLNEGRPASRADARVFTADTGIKLPKGQKERTKAIKDTLLETTKETEDAAESIRDPEKTTRETVEGQVEAPPPGEVAPVQPEEGEVAPPVAEAPPAVPPVTPTEELPLPAVEAPETAPADAQEPERVNRQGKPDPKGKWIRNPIKFSETEGEMELAMQRDAKEFDGSEKEFIETFATIEDVNLSLLESGQKIIEPEGVEFLTDEAGREGMKLPLIVQYKDKMIVRDGNTRIAADMAAGKETIKARVLYVSETATPPAVPKVKPGAKKKTEPTEPTDTTSTKHAKTEELRAKAGLPDRVPSTPEKVEDWEEQARRDYPDAEARLKVVGIAEQHPERIGKVQDAAIGHHLVDLNNRLNAGEDVQDELLRTVKASEAARTEAGRTLRGGQTERYSDFSVAGLIRQHLDTVGTDPSPEEMTRYKEMADKIEQLEGTVKEAEKKAVQDEIDKRIAGISAKRRETIESRFEKQYETAADFGIDPKALREAAEERAEAEAATAREYNAAYKAVVKATGLTPAVIRDRETSEDLAEYKGLDTTAPALAREFPELGLQPESEGAEQTKDHAQALVELIKQGPRFVPQWHDKLAEVAREMSSESGKPVADDFQFPWEGVSGEGAFAPDSPAGAKKPTRAKKGSKRAALQRKASEAVAAFKNAWVDVGKAAMSAGTGPTAGGLNPEVIKATARAAKAAAGVVRAYAELGVNSFVEFMANVRRDIGTISDDQVKVFRDAWDEVKSEGAIESPLGEDPEKSEIGARARQLMEAAVESGIGTLTINKDGTTTFEGTEEVVDAVHEVLSEEVPGITRDDTMQAVSQYGEFQPLNMADTKVKVRAIRGQVRQALKLQDLRNAIALSKQWLAEGVEPGVVASRLRDKKLLPKATGRQQTTPDSIERALIAEVNELKKNLPVPAESGVGQLKSALATAKTTIRNRIADLEKEIADREKIVKEHTPLEADAELLDLRKKRDSLLEEHNKIFPPKKSVFSDAQQLKMAENLLSRQVAELEADEAAGRLEPEAKPAKAPVTSAKLDVTKERKAELLAAREEARKASPAFQAKLQSKREASYLKSQQRRLAFWEARLADAKQGKLPAKRKATPESAEIIDRKLEIEKVQYQAMAEIEKVKRANWNAGQWIGHGLLEATSYIPKNLMLGLEWSFFKRQGFFYGRAHPIRAFANAVQAIQASFSARIAFAAMEDIENRPDAKEYHQGGVEFTHVSGPKHVLEEVFQSSVLRWLENTEGLIWLPLRTWAKGYMIAERGNRSFANTMKADTYDITKRDTMAAREFFGDSKPWSAEDIKEAGRISNIFSGRGTGLRGGNPWLDFVFLARRWAWSRIQTDFVVPFQLMTPKKIGQWNADRGMRVAVAKLYLQTLLGHATKMAIGYWIYMLAAGDDDDKKPTIEWDLRSTDAWKLKVGETTIDDMGGTVQPLVLAARVATGELKTRGGEIKSIYGEDVQYGGQTAADFIINYGKYKLGTGPSAILEWASGQDAVGQPVTKTDIVVSRVTPLTWREIADAEKELGVEQGTLAALEAIFGATVSTYGPRTKYRKADKEERKELFEKGLKQMQWDSGLPAYSEFLTAEQTKQVEDRIEEKRQGVIYDATDKKPIQAKHGSKEAYEKALKTWETQQERFEGLSKEEEASSYAKAHEMLLLHFADVAGKRDEQAAVDKALKRGEAPPSITGKKPRLKKNGEPWGHVVKNSGGNLKPSYKDRRAALKELYGVK